MIIKRIVPLDAANWPDLERLFGPDGACVGCWCMWWRTGRADYRAGSGNRAALRSLVDDGEPTGLLAYDNQDDVVGWAAVAPRTAYPRFARTAVGKARVDPTGRWAVPCFFIAPQHRRHGYTDDLLAAACEHSRAHGATALEGYPLTSKAGPSELFVGTGNLFARHGFQVVGTPTARRAVMERVFREA